MSFSSSTVKPQRIGQALILPGRWRCSTVNQPANPTPRRSSGGVGWFSRLFYLKLLNRYNVEEWLKTGIHTRIKTPQYAESRILSVPFFKLRFVYFPIEWVGYFPSAFNSLPALPPCLRTETSFLISSECRNLIFKRPFSLTKYAFSSQ